MTNRPLDIEYLPIYYITGHRIAARALIARRNVHSVDLRSPTECTFRRPMRAYPVLYKVSEVKVTFVYNNKKIASYF